MAWTAPMTAVDGNVFTAAQFNTNIRDNLLETAPAKATVSGSHFAGTGLNSIAERVATQGFTAAAQPLTVTGIFTDLTGGGGPSVTVTTGTKAIILFKAHIAHSVSNLVSAVSYSVSGATSINATFNNSAQIDGIAAGEKVSISSFDMQTNLTPGVNTFTLRYWTSVATATFELRELIVFPL